VTVGTSVGIALDTRCASDAETLPKSADMALYRAKADGRGTYRFFEPIMNAEAQGRHALETDLRRAVANNEFEPLFQPILDTQTYALNGLEALVRWRHQERGLVPPMEFIPLAEEIGLIVPLGDWIVREACRQAARWPGATTVAVNLSPAQFKNPRLVATIRGALKASGLAAERLKLEITESVLLQDTPATLKILDQLQSLGLSISLDDFGTGDSSIGYLRSFRFDTIKIDRSFIATLGSSHMCWRSSTRSWILAARWACPSSPRVSRRLNSLRRCGGSGAAKCRAICSASRCRSRRSPR
jgi:EAL domain-containing protein (putative c-di-GMP-specific phosphodiesterase class I)